MLTHTATFPKLPIFVGFLVVMVVAFLIVLPLNLIAQRINSPLYQPNHLETSSAEMESALIPTVHATGSRLPA